MLTIRVTNDTATSRTWCVEPYGDEVVIKPEGVLEIDVPLDATALVEISLADGAGVVWPTVEGPNPAWVEGLRLNGESLWPEQEPVAGRPPRPRLWTRLRRR